MWRWMRAAEVGGNANARVLLARKGNNGRTEVTVWAKSALPGSARDGNGPGRPAGSLARPKNISLFYVKVSKKSQV
jgi:hypothetical protein